ncbi:MAG: hypothetical protein ABI390_01465, partial [Daejeonella sp.]
MKTFKLSLISFGVLVFSAISSCQEDIPAPELQVQEVPEMTYYCDQVPFCHGKVQSFVVMKGEVPVSLGIRVSENTLTGLPSDPAKNIKTAQLTIPTQAKDIGIDHIDFGWNPQGHEPEPIYTLPHFDVHFFMVSKADQAGVIPGPDPIIVESKFIPQNYVSGVVAVPYMGVHYGDVTSPELHGSVFTSTYIYGFYQGKMTFWEPMFTRAFLETKPTFSAAVKQPAAF